MPAFARASSTGYFVPGDMARNPASLLRFESGMAAMAFCRLAILDSASPFSSSSSFSAVARVGFANIIGPSIRPRMAMPFRT